MENQLINGEAFLCIKDVFYKSEATDKIGKRSFTKGKLYYVSQDYYLLDDRNITKNYAWFKENFERSAADDKTVVKIPRGRYIVK